MEFGKLHSPPLAPAPAVFDFQNDQNVASDLGLHRLQHYENTPIQLYWKFYHQKMKIFR